MASYFTRRRQAPPPIITENERRAVNNYLRRVIKNANGNVSGLNIRINQTTRRKITNADLALLNNREAKKLHNKLRAGGALINNRFKGRNVFSKTFGAAMNAGWRTATAVAGGAAGLTAGVVGGISGSQLERQLILDVPALIAGDWEKSRIIRYISEKIAESTELEPAKVHSLLLKLIMTGRVLNKNKETQVNWGRNLGRQLADVYINYSKIPKTRNSPYKNVKNGVLRGFGRAYFPRMAAARNLAIRALPRTS